MRVSLDGIWPISLCFKHFPFEAEVMQFRLGHGDHGLTSSISQSSEPIQDMLKRHWCAWQTSGRGRAEGVSVHIFRNHL